MQDRRAGALRSGYNLVVISPSLFGFLSPVLNARRRTKEQRTFFLSVSGQPQPHSNSTYQDDHYHQRKDEPQLEKAFH